LLFWWSYSEAGAVKNNKIKKVPSDFMEIERQGISVSTSVLAFNYQDKKIKF
jgi:peptide chain release factor 3